MPWQIGRRIRTKQPQRVTRINPSNGITRGMTSCLLPSISRMDVVTGETWVEFGNPPRKSAGPGGVCIDLTVDYGGLYFRSAIMNTATAEQTHLVLCELSASFDNYYAILFASSKYDGSAASLHFQKNANGDTYAIYPTLTSLSGYTKVDLSTIIFCGDATNSAAYQNGNSILASGPAVVAHSAGKLSLFGDSASTPNYAVKGKVYLTASWSRRLSVAEIKSLSANPWQLFEPEPMPWFFTSGTAPQLLAPTGEISGSTWIASSGGTTFSCVDEATADGADYAYTLTPGAWVEWSFDAPDTGHNGSAAGGYARYQLPAGSGSITVTLRQGATILETYGPHTLTGSTQDFAQLIAATTSNSTDLRIRFTAS